MRLGITAALTDLDVAPDRIDLAEYDHDAHGNLARKRRTGRFDGEPVEDGLENLTATKDHALLRAVRAGLIVRNAQLTVCPAFNQIDIAVELIFAGQRNRPSNARRIASFLGRKSDSELEVNGQPFARSVGHTLQPSAQIRADSFDAVAPHLEDSRRQLVALLFGHGSERLVKHVLRLRQVLECDRQAARLLQSPHEIRLHAMKDTATGERVHLHQRNRLFAWLELVDRREQKLIGALCVSLKPRGRVGPLGEKMVGQRFLYGFASPYETVGA